MASARSDRRQVTVGLSASNRRGSVNCPVEVVKQKEEFSRRTEALNASSRNSTISENEDSSLEFVDDVDIEEFEAITKDGDGPNFQPIMAIQRWKKQSSATDIRRLQLNLERYQNFAGTMGEERRNMKDFLDRRHLEVKEQFYSFQEDLITHLLSLQKNFEEDFDKRHYDNMEVLGEQIKRCDMVQKQSKMCLEKLQMAEESNDKTEIEELTGVYNQKALVYEEILRRDYKAATRIDYEIVYEEGAVPAVNSIKFLAKLAETPVASKLPGFLSTAKEADFTKREVHDLTRIEGKDSADKADCCFTGCVFISGGRMIVVDNQNKNMKMFKKNGTIQETLVMPASPWDITVIDEVKVAVTVPGEKVVYVVGVEKEMNVLGYFETGTECWGITFMGDKFAVTCNPWSNEPFVKLFSLSGEEIGCISKAKDGSPLFMCPHHICCDCTNSILYVTDSGCNAIIAMSIDGEVLFRYKHASFKSPTGIAKDCQGNLYVCAKESVNVHQVSETGEFIRILFDKQDDLISPRGICFEPNGERIVVTDLAGSLCNEFLQARMN